MLPWTIWNQTDLFEMVTGATFVRSSLGKYNPRSPEVSRTMNFSILVLLPLDCLARQGEYYDYRKTVKLARLLH